MAQCTDSNMYGRGVMVPVEGHPDLGLTSGHTDLGLTSGHTDLGLTSGHTDLGLTSGWVAPTDKNYNPLEPLNVGVQTHGPSGLPIDAAERKAIPMFTGCFKYFPKALAGVAKLSLKGGIQHGQAPENLHWDKTKSMDHLDCLIRHIIDEDWDAVCWRALAHYEIVLDKKNTL